MKTPSNISLRSDRRRRFAVKEVYVTLQGEGFRAGVPAVFCRFTGCNLWSGLERDKSTSVCWFCDTDFMATDGVGGGIFEGAECLASHIQQVWTQNEVEESPYVVFTGGEPMLQLDEDLVEQCHKLGFEVGIETNGTLAVPDCVDWITVSPKAHSKLVQTRGNELKIVWPQPTLSPQDFEDLEFDAFYLQPMDGSNLEENIEITSTYCERYPRWSLSLQKHKLLGLP